MVKKPLKKKKVVGPKVKPAPVEKAPSESAKSPKSEKAVRASVCPKCGTVKARKAGEKPPLCQCGAQMKKAKLGLSLIKKGKVSIDELPADESHPNHPDRKTRRTVIDTETTPQLMRGNFNSYLSATKFPELNRWWEIVFPKEKYPEGKPWFLIALRIQYELLVRAHVADGKAITVSELLNYNAVMALDEKKLSPTLQGMVQAYENSRQRRLDKEEEKLIKANKD